MKSAPKRYTAFLSVATIVIVALLFCAPAFAQIIVTNATFPVAGDTLKMAVNNSPSVINLIFTPPGGPQTWDLSGLSVDGTQNFIYRAASEGSVSGQVSGAELVTVPPSPHAEEYYNVTGTRIELQAYHGIAPYDLVSNALFTYGPPLEERQAPLDFSSLIQYGSSSGILEKFLPSAFTPSLLAALNARTSPSQPDSLRYRVAISQLDVVNAYGSMSIPGGTYNVLREVRTRYTETRLDGKYQPLGWLDVTNDAILAGWHGLGVDTTVTFSFYNDVAKEPIARVTLNAQQNAAAQTLFKYNVPTPTPTGTNVVVQPQDNHGGTTPVTLTFATVTQAGSAFLETSGSGAAPPSGFALGTPAVYYDLSTTATVTGNIQVCINYTGTTFTDESALQLRHYEGGVWVDITTSRDAVNNIICGSATSLSPFAIFEPTAPVATNPTGVGAANPSSVAAGGTSLLTVTVTPGTNPTSTGLSVAADLSAIGGSATQMFFDNGTNGDVTAGDNIFSYNATIAGATTPGNKNLSVTITDAEARTGNASISIECLGALTPPTFSKSFSPDAIDPNGVSTLTFTIDNSTSSVAATSLDFTDNLPAGMVVASPANASVTCTGGTITATSGTGVITYTGGTLSAGASCTIQVDVTSAVAGAHVNTTGDLTSSLGNSGTATATLTVNPPPVKPFVFLTNKITLSSTKQVPSYGDMHSNGTLTVTKGDPSTYNSNLTAVGKITIEKYNTINGNVKAPSISNSGKIIGTKTIGAVASEPLPSLSYSAGGPNKSVPGGGALTLAPGSYGNVTMGNNGKLKLTSGEYFINQLRYSDSIEGGVIEIDLSSGNPVTINVVNDLQLGHEAAIVLKPNGEADSKLVTFNTLQTTNAYWGREAYLVGSFNAPNAVVTLVKNTQLRGSICAKEIFVSNDCLFLHHDSPGSLPGPGNLPKSFAEEADSYQLIAESYELSQNYPNPFNPSTVISFQLPVNSDVTLSIFNTNGQLVKRIVAGEMAAGRHSFTWDATNERGERVASGVYLYVIKASEFSAQRKLVLMK